MTGRGRASSSPPRAVSTAALASIGIRLGSSADVPTRGIERLIERFERSGEEEEAGEDCGHGGRLRVPSFPMRRLVPLILLASACEVVAEGVQEGVVVVSVERVAAQAELVEVVSAPGIGVVALGVVDSFGEASR